MGTYELGPFRLDTHSGLLLRGSEPVALGRRAVALLQALVERPGALVSKDALIEAAWPGQVVEDSNLPAQIAALRRALGEAPGGDRWIETMPRRGYRFVGPVVTEKENSVAAAPAQVNAPRSVAPIRDDEAERRQITALSCELARRRGGSERRGSRRIARGSRRLSAVVAARPGVVGSSSAWLPRRRSSLCALHGGSGRRRISSPERGSRRSKQLAP